MLQSSDSDEPNFNINNNNNNNNNNNITRPISNSLSTQIRPKSSLNARYTISSDDPIQVFLFYYLLLFFIFIL